MKLKKHIGVKLIMLVALLFSTMQLNAQLAPNLLYPYPNDSCITVGEPITFSWDSVSGAYGYYIQISSSATWTTPDITETYLTQPTTTFTMDFPNYYTNYYWRVSSKFHDTTFSSATRRLTTEGTHPTLLDPSNQESCVSLNPVFEWTSMANATGYRIQIGYSATFTGTDLVYENLSLSSTTMSSRTFTTTLPHNYRNYYWRVGAVYGSCISEWSTPIRFSTIQAIPTTLYPQDNSVGLATNSSLSWTATGPLSEYDVQFASDANFNNIIHNLTGLTTTSTTLSPLALNTFYFWRVKSKVLSCESAWSATKRFKTQYAAPTLDNPYDGRICLDLNYQFRWNQVTGSQSYQIQIAYDSLFTDISYQQEGIFDLYNLATLTKGLTNHYWRVRAKDQNNVGSWSSFRTFRTTMNYVEPIEPPANSSGARKALVFKWSDVANGTGVYHLQISLSPNFADTLFNHVGLTSTTFSKVLPDYNKEYYWRVAASGEQCEIGFSAPWKFRTVIDKPTLTTPVDLADNQPYNILFKWTAIDSATHYEFYLSKKQDFIPVIFGTDLCPTNEYLYNGLEPGTKYYWRVRAVNKSGMSDYSSIYTFTTITRGAGIPELQSPPIGAEQVGLNPLLTWRASDRAKLYHLQVADNPAFSSPIVNIDTFTVTFHQMNNLLNDKIYYWRVAAINDSGKTNWSRLGMFSTLLTIPGYEPLLVSPKNGEQDVNVKIILDWDLVTHATSYDMQIATDAQFTQIVQQDSSHFGSDKLISGLEYETTYYWRARGRNISGTGPWSEPFSFKTKVYVSVKDELTQKFDLKSYPNPFTKTNYLTFNLKNVEDVTVKVYDISGREITTLVNQKMNSGENYVKWEPGNLPNGTYFYFIQIGNLKSYQEVHFTK